jgi:uncharacterized protein
VRGREEIAGRIGAEIVKRLVGRRVIEAKDETKLKQAIQRVIAENLAAEEQLDVDARRLLQEHARDIREKGLDYRQLFSKAREKLARDRGFVL